MGKELTNKYRDRMFLLADLIRALYDSDTSKEKHTREKLDEAQIDLDGFIKKFVA